MLHPFRKARKRAFTLTEILVVCGVTGLVAGVMFGSYVALQRTFGFTTTWSDTRMAQNRLMESIGLDLRNAMPSGSNWVVSATNISVTSSGITLNNVASTALSGTFLAIRVPQAYSAYLTSGHVAGDPSTSGTMMLIITNTSTGVVSYDAYSNGSTLTGFIYYSGTYRSDGAVIQRTITFPGVSNSTGTRDVAVFPNGVTLNFAGQATTGSGTTAFAAPLTVTASSVGTSSSSVTSVVSSGLKTVCVSTTISSVVENGNNLGNYYNSKTFTVADTVVPRSLNHP